MTRHSHLSRRWILAGATAVAATLAGLPVLALEDCSKLTGNALLNAIELGQCDLPSPAAGADNRSRGDNNDGDTGGNDRPEPRPDPKEPPTDGGNSDEGGQGTYGNE